MLTDTSGVIEGLATLDHGIQPFVALFRSWAQRTASEVSRSFPSIVHLHGEDRLSALADALTVSPILRCQVHQALASGDESLLPATLEDTTRTPLRTPGVLVAWGKLRPGESPKWRSTDPRHPVEHRCDTRLVAALTVADALAPKLVPQWALLQLVVVSASSESRDAGSVSSLPGICWITVNPAERYSREITYLGCQLVHELYHTKLTLAEGLKLWHPQSAEVYSPWKKRPRPIRQVYHAFITFGAAELLWARLAFSEFADQVGAEEIRLNLDWLRARSAAGFHILRASGALTPIGETILDRTNQELGRARASWGGMGRAFRMPS